MPSGQASVNVVRVCGKVKPVQHSTRNRLREQSLYSKGNSEVARPFIEKVLYRLKAYLPTANPRSDDRKEYRHKENRAHNIDSNMSPKAIAVSDNFPRKPLGGLISKQY
jgi:hypothetical protein